MNLFLRDVRHGVARALRKRPTRILLVWAPLGIGLLMGGVFLPRRAPGDLPVAVWDQDGSAASRRLLCDLAANQAFRIAAVVTDMDEGRRLMAGGRVRGFFIVPRGYARALARRDQAQVICYQDFTALLAGRTLSKNLYKLEASLQTRYLARTFQDLGMQPSATDFFATPLTVSYRKLFNPSLEYTQFLLPGILTATLFQVLVVIAGIFFYGPAGTLAGEGPLGRWLAVRTATFLLLSLLPFLVTSGLLFPLFGLATGPFWKLLIVFLPFALATLGLGLFLAALTRNPVITTELMIILGAAGFTFSGFTWPRAMFVPVVDWFAAAVPLTFLLEESSKVWYATGFAVNLLPLLVQATAYFALATVLLRFRRPLAPAGGAQ